MGNRGVRGGGRNSGGSDLGGGCSIPAGDGHSHHVSAYGDTGCGDRTAWGSAATLGTAAGIGFILFLGLGWLLVFRACMRSEAAASERRRVQTIVRPAPQAEEKTSQVFAASGSLLVTEGDF